MTTTAINHEEYRQQIARVGVNPFLRQVVQTPWSAVTDVATLHSDIRNHFLSIVLGCDQPNAVRCCAMFAPAGYGKTHILAWLRDKLENKNDNVYFAYVPPFNPNEKNARTPMQHIVHSVYDAVWNRSQKQRHSFEQSIRSFLVSCYDGLIKDKNHGQVKKVLGVGTIWEWLFSWSGLTIGGKEEKAKLAALRSAIRRREFLNYAFQMLRQKEQTAPTGVETDWDTFVACCLLACGNTMQQWNGSEWFTQTTMTSMADLAKAHIDHPCKGQDKLINALYTIQLLCNCRLAIAHDQLETTFNTIFNTNNESASQNLANLFGIFISTLLTIPRIANIYSFQASNMELLYQYIPTMLFDRIVEGYGIKKLQSITLDQAKDLVRVYMRLGVWSQLKIAPPDDEKLYPFTAAEIAENHIAINQELRPFLRWCCKRFAEWLSRPIAAQKMTISSIQPTNIISETPQPLILKGTHLPANIRVTFNGIVSALTPIARPADGEIDVTPPPNLPTGPVTVCIEETKNPENQATITLDVTSITDVPRPYSYWIDGKKLKSQREHLKQLHSPQYTQDWVSEEINRSLPHLRLNKNRISQLENGKWTDAPDEVYDSLAALYGVPLHQLQREASSP